MLLSEVLNRSTPPNPSLQRNFGMRVSYRGGGGGGGVAVRREVPVSLPPVYV